MDFGQLIAKHPLRWEIWTVLRFYRELNINQLSKFVKQSRYTVSRHLKSMELEGMLFSREIQPLKRGKYAPKYYRINPRFVGPIPEEISKIDDYMEEFFAEYKVPINEKKRIEFYESILKEIRYANFNYSKTLDSFNFLFDFFDLL